MSCALRKHNLPMAEVPPTSTPMDITMREPTALPRPLFHARSLRQRHLSEQTLDSTCPHICNASDGAQPASKDGVETTSPRPKLEGRSTYPVFQF